MYHWLFLKTLIEIGVANIYQTWMYKNWFTFVFHLFKTTVHKEALGVEW